MRQVGLLAVVLLCWFGTTRAAEEFAFPREAARDGGSLSRAMPVLARDLIANYREPDPQVYLDNLFRLQLVAQQYDAALKSIAELSEIEAVKRSPYTSATLVQSQLFAQAKLREVQDYTTFETAFAAVFRETFARLDDRMSALVAARFMSLSQGVLEHAVQQAVASQNGRDSISPSDALKLSRVYQVETIDRVLGPLLAVLISEDDERRYVIERNVPVKTPDDAVVCALIVRPRNARGPLTTLLNYTIYASPRKNMQEARRTASNGYAAVEGLTRGKVCSPGPTVPMEHDGADAAALIDWIAQQPWSDGRVGTFGGSYEGFTQWSAAKRMPKALKAMMPVVTFIPGIDEPNPLGLFHSGMYPYPFYTTNSKTLDDAAYFDPDHWDRLYQNWYVSGRAYRDLEKMDGTANPVFARWLEHPTYDAYWQSLTPQGSEFARIDIPVLATTGYYDGGQMGVLHCMTEHTRFRPNAEHYLVIGPYDHLTGQRGTQGTEEIRGYELDPVAQVDLGDLRYEWFDYVFKGTPKPALLKDRVNYQVMGANEWKHASTLTAMSTRSMRFYLGSQGSGLAYRLESSAPPRGKSVTLTVDLADRSDVERVAPPTSEAWFDSWNDDERIVSRALRFYNGIAFESEPLDRATELSGLFSGRLEFVTNKRDFDFNVQLYELLPSGEYMQLSFYAARASLVSDITQRHLLQPNVRQRLDFRSRTLTSRLLQPGSRLVVVLKVVKRPDMQINYGTGKDVSDETIADATSPLVIEWLGSSFIDFPMSR